MSYLVRQVVMGVVLGIAVLIVALIVVNHSTGSGVDKYSYTKGYDAFGGAYLPTDTRNREDVEADCHSMFRARQLQAPDTELIEKDWVQGCADVAQNKDSRFK
ncbi:hypothetical protein ABZ446_41745 [Streptomyces sp. NPDC005813]|uniref:hypothetical protein n=1 Tax=Streptomyces sp. NPDC005813 TaxID=3155592 RepID=UPI0033E42339